METYSAMDLSNCPVTFTYWTPDEVAECTDGLTDYAYGTLWEAYETLPGAAYPGEIDSRRCLPAVWGWLPRSVRQEIADAAEVIEENERKWREDF